ncbi:MAG TPA: ribonuclease P protein component [Dehalococcoidia bacterium]|nr:ribonuclease P protein component [Dehalococcoidia bacterium]
MKREQRLRRRKDFAAAYRKGRAQGNQLLVIRVHANGSSVTRFGFVAGKAVGGAVVRNRVKRRLREAARRIDVQPGLDIVIGARKPSAGAPYGALYRSFEALARRSGALLTREAAADPQEDA